MEAKEGHIPPSDSILFILVCFSVGVLIRLGLKWTKIPYTAMLLLVGLGIGFLQLAHPAAQAFTNTLQLWLAMEPHLLLLIFLPIIGFSAAIAQEPHMLRKSWGQIMVLAWPGVVVQFLLIALCAKYVFPYDWSWPEAFLFGAMMSATDPVAVVAVLQEVRRCPIFLSPSDKGNTHGLGRTNLCIRQNRQVSEWGPSMFPFTAHVLALLAIVSSWAATVPLMTVLDLHLAVQA